MVFRTRTFRFDEAMTIQIKSRNSTVLSNVNLSDRLRKWKHFALGLLLMVQITSCSEFNMRWEIGQKSDVDVLETRLVVGKSTKEEVRAALGNPTGNGALMIPILDNKPRKIWSYYYDRGSATALLTGKRHLNEGQFKLDDRRIVLFIYFDGDRYTGYQWFSTLPEHAQEHQNK